MMQRRIFILAAGATGQTPALLPPDGPADTTIDGLDARPVDLREPVRAMLQSMPWAAPTMPRQASRLAQLAVLGALQCLRDLPVRLAGDTPLYLATGLGDIARTDALYYDVMPPSGGPASPAQFVSSGNNMAAFFVARQAGLSGRNFTVSQDSLSLEQALSMACAELRRSVSVSRRGRPLVTRQALVGAVDETRLPREFYERRFAPAARMAIGEGSSWFVLGTDQHAALGELLDVAVVELPDGSTGTVNDWAGAVARRVIQGLASSARPDDAMAGHATGAAGSLILATGCRVNAREMQALIDALGRTGMGDDAGDCSRGGGLLHWPYLRATGCFPTAAGQMLAAALSGHAANDASVAGRPAPGTTLVHVNRDENGMLGLIAVRVSGPHGR